MKRFFQTLTTLTVLTTLTACGPRLTPEQPFLKIESGTSFTMLFHAADTLGSNYRAVFSKHGKDRHEDSFVELDSAYTFVPTLNADFVVEHPGMPFEHSRNHDVLASNDDQNYKSLTYSSEHETYRVWYINAAGRQGRRQSKKKFEAFTTDVAEARRLYDALK